MGSWGFAALHPRAGSPAEQLGWGARLYAVSRSAGFENVSMGVSNKDSPQKTNLCPNFVFTVSRSQSMASVPGRIRIRAGTATGESYPYKILDETPRCSVATVGLPVGDQRVLGEEPGQRRP